jgi:hypothetical protein
MAELYADEDFSLPVVQHLRQFRHNVLTAVEAGQSNQGVTDASVLAFAAARRRAVVTFNRRHFIKLHQQGAAHWGIIVCTPDKDVLALASRINQAISGTTALQDQLIRIHKLHTP